MNNLESTINMIFPTAVKLIVIAGIIIILLSITITVYKRLQLPALSRSVSEDTLQGIRRDFIVSLVIGGMICTSGLLINFIKDFNVDFSEPKFFGFVFIGYAISLIVFLLFTK